MTKLDVPRLENYLRFHLKEIQEQLRSDAESESDRMWCAKWGSVATVLKEHLMRSRDDIMLALARIQTGTYGNCVGCGNEIKQQQLEVVPWLKLCIVCQEECDHRSAEHTDEPRRSEITSWG